MDVDGRMIGLEVGMQIMEFLDRCRRQDEAGGSEVLWLVLYEFPA